jgi:hypothetical protein
MDHVKNSGAMTMPVRVSIGIATALLSVLALGCGIVFLFSCLMFDNPSATESLTTWNFAFSHMIFVFAYGSALPGAAGAVFKGRRDEARSWLIRISAGLGWLVLAYGILIFGCHGRFVCALLN